MTVTRTLVCLLIFCIAPHPALAGKNSGGALVVHTDDTLSYRFFGTDYCDPYETVDPGSCEALVSQSNYYDPNGLNGTVVWILAAFPQESMPGVSGVSFGLEHNFPPDYHIHRWNFCGPPDAFETPDPGWPYDWIHAGNSVSFGSPVVGDLLFPIYWLGVYGESGDFIGTRINPSHGDATFMSDDNPVVVDRIVRFGQLRWFEPGFNTCPEDPIASIEESPSLEETSWGNVRAANR